MSRGFYFRKNILTVCNKLHGDNTIFISLKFIGCVFISGITYFGYIQRIITRLDLTTCDVFSILFDVIVLTVFILKIEFCSGEYCSFTGLGFQLLNLESRRKDQTECSQIV